MREEKKMRRPSLKSSSFINGPHRSGASPLMRRHMETRLCFKHRIR